MPRREGWQWHQEHFCLHFLNNWVSWAKKTTKTLSSIYGNDIALGWHHVLKFKSTTYIPKFTIIVPNPTLIALSFQVFWFAENEKDEYQNAQDTHSVKFALP